MGNINSKNDENERMDKDFTFKGAINIIKHDNNDCAPSILIGIFKIKFNFNKIYEGWNILELTHFMRVSLMYKPNIKIIQTLIDLGANLFDVDVDKKIVIFVNSFINFNSNELAKKFIKYYSYKIFKEFDIWNIRSPLIKPARPY
jgi:hypothetical protein